MKYAIRASLFFYTKKIRVHGRENIPKKGAVIFLVNHPNGLIDPLVVATNNPRMQHFLVRAAAFKKPIYRKFLATLNMMPIYRIRDGVKELSKNHDIFESCFKILRDQKALMIFPEGSHNRMRTIRTLSKGFTRIIYGTLEKYPHLTIQIVPVGLTYQNASKFPSKVALHYGKSIVANNYVSEQNQHQEILRLKEDVSEQLKKLTVHIPYGDAYEDHLKKLNEANVDFTKVDKVNKMIQNDNIISKPRKLNFALFLKPLIILNSLIPYLIWKQVEAKIDEIEFVDTFRFGFNTVLVFLFYLLQTVLVGCFLGWKTSMIYLIGTLIVLTLYAKTHTTPTESHPE